MKVYLLVECSGRYDAYSEKIVGAFMDGDEARQHFHRIQQPFGVTYPYAWHEVWEVPVQAEIGEEGVVVHLHDWFSVPHPESC